MSNSIDEEIKKESKRIEERTSQITSEIKHLEKKIDFYTSCAWTFVIAGIVLVAFGIVYFLYYNEDPGFALNLLGDFMAGTVTASWSLAGLFLIYVAFLGQKQQLLHQQFEIMYSQLEVKYTRLELEGQKKQMIEQNKTLRQQKFENTFFNMLSLHHQIVNSMDVTDYQEHVDESLTIKGGDVFKYWYMKLKQAGIEMENQNNWETTYLRFYEQASTDFGRYFRNLYRMIKLIDQSEFNIKDGVVKEGIDNIKYNYVCIIRSQLSDYELRWIFYNGLSTNGCEKLKPLIEKYSLLKNIPPDKVPLFLRKKYKLTAFEKLK